MNTIISLHTKYWFNIMKMKKIRQEPRISLNKLAEYITATPTRKDTILKQQKYPKDYMVTYYAEAERIVVGYLSYNDLADRNKLFEGVQRLQYQLAETTKSEEKKRLDSNLAALFAFLAMIDSIDLNGASLKRMDNRDPSLTLSGVEVSVRPEVMVTKTHNGKQKVGAIKIHFSKTSPLNEEAQGYVSAGLQLYCEDKLADFGIVDPKLCLVIDVHSQKIMSNINNKTQRMKNIKAACSHIKTLWNTV
jgi:hypothetical protein